MAKGMTADLEGFHQLVRNMNKLKDNPLKKATRAGITAGLTPLVKAMKTQINSSSASASLKRQARLTIGKSLKKKSGTYDGKAGFAVGKQSKAKKSKAHARSMDKTKAGVGVSASNIHWFVLGTKNMDAKFAGVVPLAARAAAPAMLAAAKKKMATVLEREARRMKK